MSDKRLTVKVCPACEGTILPGDAHTPNDDLRAIRRRDAAYDAIGGFSQPLGQQATGRMQMAADRRMLLRMLDAELSAEFGVSEIIVNGRTVSTEAGTLSYEQLVEIAAGRPGDTVTVHYHRDDDKRGRAPVAGESVDVLDRMVVDVVDTSRA